MPQAVHPPLTSKRELEVDLKSAQKIWEQRIAESDRARKAERVAKSDLIRAASRLVRHITKRK